MRLSFLSLITFFVLAVTACSSNNDAQKADALLQEAQQAYDKGDYERCQLLIDSISSAYPSQEQARQGAMYLSRKLLENVNLCQLSTVDSIGTALQIKIDSLSSQFDLKQGAEENFYIHQGQNPSQAYTESGLQARVNLDGTLWLIVTNAKKNVDATALRVSSGDSQVLIGNIWNEGPSLDIETLNLSGQNADTICSFIADHISQPITLTFLGSKGQSELSLSSTQAQDAVAAFQLSMTVTDIRLNEIEKEKLNRKIQLARDQQARTFPEKTPEADKTQN